MASCAYVMRVGRMLVGTNGDMATLKCSADAVAGSAYCPVHDQMARGINVHVPRTRVKRALDNDVLPWTDDDRTQFKKGRKFKT